MINPYSPAASFSGADVPVDYRPESFAISGAAGDDNIGLNHPSYARDLVCWTMMRDAVSGEDAVKRNAYKMGYVMIPEGLMDRGEAQGGSPFSPASPASQHDLPTAAQHYIQRGRFPEVPARHLTEVEGYLFGHAHRFDAPSGFKTLADSFDALSGSIEDFARDVAKEYFAIYRQGVYIQWNEAQARPEFIRYSAESLVNWKIGADGFPSLIVIEENYPDETQSYAHVMRTRRVQLSVEDGVFTYREFERGEDGHWAENLAAAKIPSRRGRALTQIPFVLFGRWDGAAPPLKPIVKTAIDYYRAHTEWSHGLFYSAHPTLFATLDEGGSIVGAQKDEAGHDLPYAIDVGAAKAHAFIKGRLEYAEVSGASLAALKDRVLETRKELAGLGARSFINYGASNITARTEGLQHAGEAGVIASLSRDISQKITACLRWAAEWMDIPSEAVVFKLDDTQNDMNFDAKALPVLFEGIDRGLWTEADVRGYVKENMPMLVG